MKSLLSRYRLLCLLLLSFLLPGMSLRAEKPGAPDFSTPQGTVKALAAAVMAKDSDALKACFTEKAIEEDELGLSELQKKPEAFWAEWQGIFQGPQNIVSLHLEGDSAKMHVKATENEHGGLGNFELKKVEGEWKIDEL